MEVIGSPQETIDDVYRSVKIIINRSGSIIIKNRDFIDLEARVLGLYFTAPHNQRAVYEYIFSAEAFTVPILARTFYMPNHAVYHIINSLEATGMVVRNKKLKLDKPGPSATLYRTLGATQEQLRAAIALHYDLVAPQQPLPLEFYPMVTRAEQLAENILADTKWSVLAEIPRGVIKDWMREHGGYDEDLYKEACMILEANGKEMV